MALPPLLEAMGVCDPPRRTLPEGWFARARAVLDAELQDGLLVCAEDVRQAAEIDGLEPAPDGRAWGSVFASAKRLGIIADAGYSHRYAGSPPRPRLVRFWRPA